MKIFIMFIILAITCPLYAADSRFELKTPQGYGRTDLNISYVDVYGRMHQIDGGYWANQIPQSVVIDALAPMGEHLINIQWVFDAFYIPDIDALWIIYYINGYAAAIVVLPTFLLAK